MAAEGAVRTTGRIKKPKHFFDPSDYDVPRPFRASSTTAQSASSDRNSTGSSNAADQKKANRSPSTSSSSAAANTPTEPVDVCCVCFKRDAKRGIHSKNKLVRCQKCDKKIHRLCLPTDFEDFDALVKNYNCTKCRKCAQCNNVSANGQDPTKHLITCAKCVKSYHLRCHNPPVVNYQEFLRTWKCSKCMQPKPEEIREIIGGTADNKAGNQSNNNNNNNNNNSNQAEKTKIAAQKETLKRSAGPVGNDGQQTKQPTAEQQQQKQQQQREYQQQQKSKQMPALYKYQQQPQQQQSLLQKPIPGGNGSQQQQQQKQQQSLVKVNSLQQQQQAAFNEKSLSAKNLTSYLQTNGKVVADSGGADVAAAKKPKLVSAFSLQTPAVTSSDSVSAKDEQHSHSSTPASTTTTYSSTDAIDIPTNVKYWSVDKVFEYFLKYFPNEAHVFKDQEIDGMSLLLLKRSDVVKKLPIKLGPSLRLYNLILKIQAQVNDPTLGWNVGQ